MSQPDKDDLNKFEADHEIATSTESELNYDLNQFDYQVDTDSENSDTPDQDLDHDTPEDNELLEVDSTEDSAPPDLNYLAKSLEIKLKAEAGSILISLHKLLTLHPGDILHIAELPPKVNLVVNNVVIGAGYLVEFNGSIGVKISELTKVALD